MKLPNEVVVAPSLQEALQLANKNENVENIFVIGGSSVYAEAMGHPKCTKLYLTQVHADVLCDTFITMDNSYGFVETSSSELQSEKGISFQFQILERQETNDKMSMGNENMKNESCLSMEKENIMAMEKEKKVEEHEEMQYLSWIEKIIASGTERQDRTGTGTKSLFGVQMRYSLRNNVLPLLTTKKVFWRGVAEELLWFISGDTNAASLQKKNIRIWDGNGSREFLDGLGLVERETGDLGPVYGFQWRHFGAKYTNMHEDYTGKGVDQLANVIHEIKTNPSSRRIILSAWNPADLHLMALPPCHMFCQFYVANGELSCQMYQRSADMGLGVPFNIASYALLTRLLAQVTGLVAGELIHVIGDAHVYLNHIEPLKEQLKRTPRSFPTLTINPKVDDIDGFTYDDFTVHDYHPLSAIKMKMAV